MKNRKLTNKLDIVINVIFGVITICFLLSFGRSLYTNKNLFNQISIKNIFLVFCVAVCVHTIKALRLYIILFGHRYTFKNYLRQYIKTAVVNMMLPFKSGEIYRGYCIGRMIDSIADGYIIVIFDRFVDTLALISIIIAFGFVADIKLTSVYLFLTVFLVAVILIYNLFKPLYQYWNHFLLYNKSSKHTLTGLHFLKVCNDAFSNISFVVKGRFIMLYLLSLVAWIVEITMLVTVGKQVNSVEISTYLSDVLTGNLNFSNMIYIILCFVCFILVEIVLLINKLVKEK